MQGLSRVYLEETLRREGRFSAQLELDATDLQKILGLGVKEAREMRDDLVSKAYRRAIRPLLVLLTSAFPCLSRAVRAGCHPVAARGMSKCMSQWWRRRMCCFSGAWRCRPDPSLRERRSSVKGSIRRGERVRMLFANATMQAAAARAVHQLVAGCGVEQGGAAE